MTDASPRTVEVHVQQCWDSLVIVDRSWPLLVLDPRTGDREDFAIGLLCLLEREVMPALLSQVDARIIDACARDFEIRGMRQNAAACWGSLGNEQEFNRVEAWLRTGGAPVAERPAAPPQLLPSASERTRRRARPASFPAPARSR
jgi:hypothetical protein